MPGDGEETLFVFSKIRFAFLELPGENSGSLSAD